MNKTLVWTALAALTTLATGCEAPTFKGSLTLQAPLSIHQKADPACERERPDWWNCPKDQNQTFAAGSYSAVLSLEQDGAKKLIALSLKSSFGEQSFKLPLPEGVQVADDFVITGTQIGQNFDLAGHINTQRDDSAEQWARESCTYTTYERVCHWVPGHGNHPGHQECYTRQITHYGYQDVRYFYRTTTQTLNARFTQSGAALGDFNGQDVRNSKIYTYQGSCF